MRVLIFSTAYLPLVGGAEIAVKELTDRLSDVQFDLITARLRKDLPKTDRIGNVNIYRIGWGIKLLDKLVLPFWGALKTLKLQRANHYDSYWCVMVSFASGAAYIANWFQKKVPIILTLQEGDSEKWLRYRWLGLISLSWRLALRRTTHLTAISNYLLNRARALGYKGEATLVPNGVDLNKFTLAKGESNDLITISRLVEKNGVGDLIKSLTYLPQEINLKIIGDGLLREDLMKNVRELRLLSRVEFVGEISNESIPKHLEAGGIFVRPSLSEGQGIAFIEAMAAWLPVVATPVGGIRDFVKDGETGIFCKSHDPKSIAEAVTRLINDSTLRHKIVTNASRMVKEKYDWNLIAMEMKSKVFVV